VDFFTWKDSFCIGIERLDDQHRSFFECLNDCHAQTVTNKRATLDEALLARLKAYAAEHFETEEDMMRFFGYPDIRPQQRQHKYFASQVVDFEQAQARGNPASAQSVLNFVRDWFLEHVLAEDKKFAVFMAEKNSNGDGSLSRY